MGVSSRSLGEKNVKSANVEELLLFPVNRFLVRELFCCLPELSDGWLTAKIASDLWPFYELGATRKPTRVMRLGPRDGHTLKYRRRCSAVGYLNPSYVTGWSEKVVNP